MRGWVLIFTLKTLRGWKTIGLRHLGGSRLWAKEGGRFYFTCPAGSSSFSHFSFFTQNKGGPGPLGPSRRSATADGKLVSDGARKDNLPHTYNGRQKKLRQLNWVLIMPIQFKIPPSHPSPPFSMLYTKGQEIPHINSGAPPSGAPYSYGKQKETHELIFSWLSWLAVLLVGTYARRRRRLFPFRKQAMPFLTVDAIIGNQAFQNGRRYISSSLGLDKAKTDFNLLMELKCTHQMLNVSYSHWFACS